LILNDAFHIVDFGHVDAEFLELTCLVLAQVHWDINFLLPISNESLSIDTVKEVDLSWRAHSLDLVHASSFLDLFPVFIIFCGFCFLHEMWSVVVAGDVKLHFFYFLNDSFNLLDLKLEFHFIPAFADPAIRASLQGFQVGALFPNAEF
jgi:hypothetical protein